MIVAIKNELGNLGDNQYSNPSSGPGARKPAFNIAIAQVVPVNGRLVAAIDGSFMDDAGQIVAFTSCIFTPSGPDFTTVLSICAQGEEQTKFAALLDNFDAILKTIVWRK